MFNSPARIAALAAEKAEEEAVLSMTDALIEEVVSRKGSCDATLGNLIYRAVRELGSRADRAEIARAVNAMWYEEVL